MSDRSTQLVIVSGPSGAGKSTVVKRLLEHCPLPLELSVSATTRSPRSGEVNGKDYWFLTHEAFQQRRAAGDFLECMEVFGRGDWYGTLNETVANGLAEDKWILLEIDVQGALAVINRYPAAQTFFIHTGSLEELETRLRNRKTDSEEAILRRLSVAKSELELAHHYQHQIVNDEPTRAAEEICRLLQLAGESNQCTTN